MKIVQYLIRFRLEEGGVARAVIDLAIALAGDGHQVTLLTTDPTDLPKDWTGTNGTPHIVSVPRSHLARLGSEARRKVRSIIQQADVVHLHGVWDPICIQLGRISRQVNCPYVASIHGMLDHWTMGQKTGKKRLFLAMGGRRYLEDAAAVHCCSQIEAEQSHKWFPRGHYRVLQLLVDLSPFEQLPGPQLARQKYGESLRESKTILFLSRLHPIKQVENLIDAAAKLHHEGMNFNLIIAGSGDSDYVESLRMRVFEQGLKDCTHFSGFVDGAKKVSLLELADVFVLPSRHENWGVALIEALACGTPVITTQGVNIWRELKENAGAKIVDPNPDSLAEQIRIYLQTQKNSGERGATGRKWVMQHLARKTVLARFESLYQSLIDSPR